MILVRNIAFLVVLLMSLFVVIPHADADIYRYVDASGRVHFTDTPTHGRYDMYMKENAPVKASSHKLTNYEHPNGNPQTQIVQKAR